MDENNDIRLPAGQSMTDSSQGTPGPVTTPEPDAPPTSTLELDLAKYAALLGDTDLTEAEAAAMLSTLWSIMKAFVDLGFDVRAVDKDRVFLREISQTAFAPVSSLRATNTEDHSGKEAAE